MVGVLVSFFISAVLYAALRFKTQYTVYFERLDGKMGRIRLHGGLQRIDIQNEVILIEKNDEGWRYKTNVTSWQTINLYDEIENEDFAFRLIDNSDKTKQYKFFTAFYTLVLISVPTIMLLISGYNNIVIPNITAEKERINNGVNNQNNNVNTNEILEVSIKNFEIVPVMAANEAGEPVDIMAVNKEFEFTDSNNNTYSADKLVNHPICTYYKCKDGTICLFVGQYDENYKWTGKCRICAYKNSKLFFATENVYDNNKLVSYRRISKSSDRGQWLITDKEINNNDSKYGHTWSYRYEDIGSKVIDLEKKVMSKNFNPTKSELYSIDELEDKLKTKLVSHYYGAYDKDDNWKDSSGDAYCVQYNDDRSLKEVFKGVFLNNRYMSGHFFEKMDSDQYKHYVGVLHKDNNGIIVEYKDPNLINETLSTDQFKIYIHGEPYEKEVLELL